MELLEQKEAEVILKLSDTANKYDQRSHESGATSYSTLPTKKIKRP